jgi:hypothetical protein
VTFAGRPPCAGRAPQEAEFLRSLNETLLANQRDFKQQLAAEKARADAAGAAAKELQEQVRRAAVQRGSPAP